MLNRIAPHIALALVALMIASGPSLALAQDAVSQAPLPRSMASPFRVTPVFGASSFSTSTTVETDNFDRGFSAGLLADFGSRTWIFETGILTLQSRVNSGADNAAVDVDTWGIPLLARVNFSGQPHSTFFAKAGAMPFNANAGTTNFDIMAVGGVGGNIPLGRNSSLLLDASYNRLFTENGNLTNYQGIALLAGLSLNI